jgi:eukaryotic-like serine/threonine-protein kinase
MADLRDQLQTALAGAYTVERELGGGGMSRVFLAQETRFHRQVVIKVLAPQLAAGVSAERFEREISFAAGLQQANIVPLLTAGEVAGLPYFTMPYVDGESLRAKLMSDGRLTVEQCVGVLRDVTRALAYAHQHGVIHRDIKPANVLLSGGAAVVTDFGIAKAIDVARSRTDDATLTQLGTSLGTPTYMSPEQAAGDPDLDARADIYSVGILAYEMLAGHPPFKGATLAVLSAHVNTTPPELTRADVPVHLRRAIAKCLAKEPAARYQSADELLRDIETIMTPVAGLPSTARTSRRRLLGAAVAVVAILSVLWFSTGSMRRQRWARSEALPQIRHYIDDGQYDSAWALARRAQEAIPRDSALVRLLPRFTATLAFHTTPEGAAVLRAPPDDTASWVSLGVTPIDSAVVPAEIARLRMSKTGYRTQRGLLVAPWMAGEECGECLLSFVLEPVGSPDSDMVHIHGGTFGAFLVGTESAKALKLADFKMDLHEVTNRQYKAFVDAGGYTKRDFWPMTFVRGDKTVSWEEAMKQFQDKTGRPGPATWEAGEYATGQADLPVGGVSWYEAAAYAKFAGKSLPTIFHWARAAGIGAAKSIVPASNFESNGATRGGSEAGISVAGVFDMAGNVREWCENSAGGDQRFILGGGWTDAPYGFTDAYAQPAMDRNQINGIRLVRYLHDEPTLAEAKRPVAHSFRDYTREKPVTPAIFESFRHFYDYDRASLNARIEMRDTTNEDWTLERVSFDAAYGKERMLVNVYLPKRGRAPYQSVIFFPGSGVINLTNSIQQSGGRYLVPSFAVKNGRAVVLPILKGTFERRDSLPNDVASNSIFWRDHAVMWVKDIRRTIDYLTTRADIDTSRIAFFGHSWGSNQAPITLAVEPRIKTAVLYVAGLGMEDIRPEADPFNFLPHVTTPVLMLNGKYDFFFPLDVAQKPFFQMLGTPSDRKQWIVYEGGHDVPRVALIRETLAWLDKYLGPVR